MRHYARYWLPVIFAMAISTGVILAQSEKNNVAIDPEVDKLIRQMSDHMTSVKHFSFSFVDTTDEVQESGQKLQFSHVRSGIVSRPNKMKVETTGDITNRISWKDADAFTILDKDHNVYGQVAFSGTIDEMMDAMIERYGVSIPLADYFSNDPYGALMKRVETGEYVGLHSVEEVECHHLAFTQEDIDWQIWIDAGEKPRFRKLVITYKTLLGSPQYTAVVKKSEILSGSPDGAFRFEPPEGAEKIEFMEREKTAAKIQTSQAR